MGHRDQICWKAFLGVACAVLLGCQRPSENYAVVSLGTNVSSVSFSITHGTNHVYYYPSRARWEFDRFLKKLGFRGGVCIERRTFRTYQPADVIWVTCKYRGEIWTGTRYEASVIVTNKVKGRITSTGGGVDTQRKTTLTAWPVVHRFQQNGESMLRIKDTGSGAEVVTFQLRQPVSRTRPSTL